MNNRIMMLLMIFSPLFIAATCDCNFPEIKPQERCTYSLQFNKCRCHKYDLDQAERIGDAYDMPPEYCDDITGFKPKSWKKHITPWAREMIELRSDQCEF